MNPNVTTKRCPHCDGIVEHGDMTRREEEQPHADPRQCVRALANRLTDLSESPARDEST